VETHAGWENSACLQEPEFAGVCGEGERQRMTRGSLPKVAQWTTMGNVYFPKQERWSISAFAK